MVNIGDLMARWTNDRWVSTVHRVGRPGGPLSRRRQSIVFFQQPALDEPITCLEPCVNEANPSKYPPITLREHFTNQQRRLATKDAPAT